MPEITYREALRTALDEEILRDENVVIIGEEVAQYNGAYKVTEGLWKKHGDRRVVGKPISKAGLFGVGKGAVSVGMRAVVGFMFLVFPYCAFGPLINHAYSVSQSAG